MPFPIAKCQAPRPYGDEICGKPFAQTTPSKLYCSVTCSNRAHRRNRTARNKALTPAQVSIWQNYNQLVGNAPPQAEVSTAEHREAVAAALAAQPTSEDILSKLGFNVPGRAPSAPSARSDSAEPHRRAVPEAAPEAEPKRGLLPRSTEDSPPDFGSYEDPGPIDYDDL